MINNLHQKITEGIQTLGDKILPKKFPHRGEVTFGIHTFFPIC